MIRLHRPTHIEPGELRAWAYDGDPSPPLNADPNIWDLMLTEWFADDRLYVELASDDECPKRIVFLTMLRERLRRRCTRTRWSSKTTDDVLSGIHPSRWTRGTKGHGRKEKSRRKDAFALTVSGENEAKARSYAEELLQLLRGRAHPDVRELATRLERFLAEPTTIADEYWRQ